MNVSLTPELERMVNEKVASGMYGSASEVVREALRLLRERDEMRRVRRDELRRKTRRDLEGAGSLSPGKEAAPAIDEALQLIEEWMADESGFEEETWEDLKSALDEDRPSVRKLFVE